MASKSPAKKQKCVISRSDENSTGTSTRSSSAVSSTTSSHSRSDECGHSAQGKPKSSKSKSRKRETPKKSSSGISLEKVASPDDDIFTIDLTDPDDLWRKMDMLNLSEEETEDLIKQAYDINRRLKKELQEREMPEQLSRYYTISAPGGLSRSNTTIGSRLPPLEHRDGKSGKMGSAFPMSNKPTSYAQLKSKEYAPSANSRNSEAGGSAKGRNKSSKKPDWNDRFSYT